jgi:hypothetical protein
MSNSSQSFYRAFSTQIEARQDEVTGQHFLSGRLVPYDEAADVLDELPGGKLDLYREGFRRGAFAPQANAGKGIVNKINLVHRHGPSGLGYLGVFTGLRDESDGLHGDVRIMPTIAPNVEALLESGVDELSVEFRLPRADHTVEVDGVRWRVRAHLDQVALEPKAAYSQARVLAYRGEVEDQERAQAEAQAREDAERQASEQSETEKREALERAAVEAAEAEERRREWDAMASRADVEAEKQKALVREYGVTQPGGWRRDG